MKINWYNYKTGEYESIEIPTGFTDYIPQTPACQGLYSCYLAMGKSPIEAALEVLTQVVEATKPITE